VAEIAEFVTVVIAGLAVFLGIWTATHEEWIVSRTRAERLRQIKYRYLSAPGLWSSDPAERARADERLLRDIREVATLAAPDLRRWLAADRPPEPLPPDARWRSDASPASLEDLRRYYRDTRLWPQIEYLAARSEPREPSVRLSRHVPAAMFFAAIAVVGLHFGYEGVQRLRHGAAGHGGPPHAVSILLIAAAVWLPALGAGVRTWRMAQEVERNALRSQAKGVALRALATRLDPGLPAGELLYAIAACEDVLESDHREWLRLMIEAEWFG
jgi:hypothetical protein